MLGTQRARGGDAAVLFGGLGTQEPQFLLAARAEMLRRAGLRPAASLPGPSPSATTSAGGKKKKTKHEGKYLGH